MKHYESSFALARIAVGATQAVGDADGDNDVDGANLIVWQTQFPTTAVSGMAEVLSGFT